MTAHILPSFDTLQYVRRLKAADVPEKQAEAQAEALREALVDQFSAQAEASARAIEESDAKQEHGLATLETKIDEGFARVDARFAAIDERFAAIDERFAKNDVRFATIDANLAEVRGDIKLLTWMLGTLIAGVAALVLKAYF